MAATETIPAGNLLSVPGWRGAAVAAGLRTSSGADLALIQAEAPCPAAGVFTRNRLPAAPVLFCRERLAGRPEARTIVINAGIANAMTGAQGRAVAEATAERAESLCGGPALVLSTGVIGVPLPEAALLAGLEEAAAQLSRAPAAGRAVAEAIMTTDTHPKAAALRVDLPGGEATVGGMAKGSGMIHPNMATMLSVVTTDLPVAPALLDGILRRAVDRSFHEISVDGDTSTNDTVLLLAGAGSEPVARDDDPRLAPLEGAVTALMQQLASAIVHDGEGVSRVMELHVVGASSDAEARRVAVSVARSPLVKTALAGGDPNWGRILGAAANADVPLDGERLVLTLGGVRVFAGGLPLAVDQATVDAAFQAPDVLVDLSLGDGPGRARMLTSDFTKDYVRINADYRT